jgi:hypothetical protein
LLLWAAAAATFAPAAFGPIAVATFFTSIDLGFALAAAAAAAALADGQLKRPADIMLFLRLRLLQPKYLDWRL